MTKPRGHYSCFFTNAISFLISTCGFFHYNVNKTRLESKLIIIIIINTLACLVKEQGMEDFL